MLFSEFNSVSNSISNFVRIGENEFDRCSVNFTNRFPIFSATEEYGLDCHAVSRLAALRRVYGLQRLCPRVLSNQRHSHLFYLLVLFSTPLFYPQVPSMDRCRIRSVLSPDDCSNGPLVHSLRSGSSRKHVMTSSRKLKKKNKLFLTTMALQRKRLLTQSSTLIR